MDLIRSKSRSSTGLVRCESERPQSLARLEVGGQRSEVGNGRSTRLHYSTDAAANDELTSVLVLVLIIVIECQKKGRSSPR